MKKLVLLPLLILVFSPWVTTLSILITSRIVFFLMVSGFGKAEV